MREPLNQPNPKHRYVNNMFDRIAKRYDLMNTLMTAGLHRRWRRKAIELAAPPKGGLSLDVGCGTGDLTVELSLHQPQAVIGIDFSVPMVTIGQHKITNMNISPLPSLGIGDALNLPFPDETFDTVATAFTLRNLTDYSAGIQEMRRVTRRGGKFVCIEICPWNNGFLSWAFHLMFKILVPLLGIVFGRDRQAYKYLPSSVSQFLQANQITALLEESGFSDVKYERLAMGAVAIHVGTAD